MVEVDVVQVALLVVVVEGVVIVLPDVVLHVNVVLVDVVSHVNVRIHILERWVVMVGNGGERVEEIGIDGFSLDHSVPFVSLGLLVGGVVPGHSDKVCKEEGTGVESEVDTVTHATKTAQSVSSHYSFILKMFIIKL